MKKILTLLLAITMCMGLVNLNNNYTKAEENPNVSELVPGPTFNGIVAQVAGGAENIKSITFVGSKPQQTGEVGKLDVSSGTGVADVYATFDSDTGAITINCVNTTIKPKTDSTVDCQRMFDNFANCESISFGNVTLDTSSATSMEGMFANCSSLKELDISKFKFNADGYVNMRVMFYSCQSLKKLILPKDFGATSTSMHGLLCDCFELTDLLTPVDNGNEITYKEAAIKVTNKCGDTNDMFSNCRSLSHIDLSKFDTSNVLDMGHMFSTCLYMTTLDISGFDTSKVLNAEKMFQGCASLFRIYVDKAKTYFNAIPEAELGTSTGMFYNCFNLQGQNNTVYDDVHLDKTYARVDTAGTPGYFTSNDILYTKKIAYDRNKNYFRQYDAGTESFVGDKVKNIEYNETTHVITINNLKIDSSINKTTLEIPDDAKEINVTGDNYINNISENSYLIISKKLSGGLDDFKFTGSGTLTLNDVHNSCVLFANSIDVNGPTINVYGNTTADILPNLLTNKLVMNNGKLIIKGGKPIGIYVDKNVSAPSITVNGGYIELVGHTVPFVEYVEDGLSLVVPKAKVTGSYSFIQGLTSNVELRLYDEPENGVDAYAYYDVDADRFATHLVFSPYTEKRYDCEESGGTVVCPVANTTSGSITDQTAHITGITFDSLKDNSTVSMVGNETIPMTKDVDYVFSPGSVCVTLKKEFLSKLPVGTHTFNIHLEDSVEPTNTVIDTTLTVKIAAAPTPTPKKDESCEKVIGPTWHWNNKKGICEDSGSVKTHSK